MNELVKVSTADVNKGIAITDSLIVAEKFKKSHNLVLRDIRSLEKELKASLTKEELGLYKFEQSSYINTQNKEQPFYKMNRDFFIMLVMGYRTKEAYKIKHEFIQAFNFLEKEIQARVRTRHISVNIRKDLTETIKNCVTDAGKFKNFAYSNYTRLIYKKVLGKDVKKIKEELNLKKSDNLRDFLTIEQLKKVQDLESKIAYYIEFTDTLNKSDKEIYEEIKIVISN